MMWPYNTDLILYVALPGPGDLLLDELAVGLVEPVPFKRIHQPVLLHQVVEHRH